MRELIQILQIVMFIIPVVSLWAMGVLLLLRPVIILHQRWRLLVFFPLLAANLLAALENNLYGDAGFTVGWGFWLVIVIDLILGVGLWITSRGFLVFGLSGEEVEAVLTEGYREAGMQVSASEGEASTFLGEKVMVGLLSVEDGQESVVFKIKDRFYETHIQTDSKSGMGLLKENFPLLRGAKTAPTKKSRATGVLFIVFGLVFAVLSWVFFFEPRLILIE